MSVDTDDEMAQRESMLHADLRIAAIRHALRAGAAVSRLHCAECGDETPETRRVLLPGVRLCADCLSWHEEKESSR